MFGNHSTVLWYLRSLFAWCMLIPMWLTPALPFTAAFCFSSVILLYGTDILGVATMFDTVTIAYFPYFVLGALIKYEGYDKALYRLAKNGYTFIVAQACVMVSFAYYIFEMNAELREEYHKYIPFRGWDKIRDEVWWHVIPYFGVFCWSTLTVFAVLCLLQASVPTSRMRWDSHSWPMSCTTSSSRSSRRVDTSLMISEQALQIRCTSPPCWQPRSLSCTRR
mmetsp:Transcript_34336/g.63685  ORF Transcript_34336/g.63685 Transcript_34336/m.63685 type:complete len:222 (-) Transcript_34336:434-1099(-)